MTRQYRIKSPGEETTFPAKEDAEVLNQEKNLIPQVKVVRVGRKCKGPRIASPEEVFTFWKDVISRRARFDTERECSIALLLNRRMHLKCVEFDICRNE